MLPENESSNGIFEKRSRQNLEWYFRKVRSWRNLEWYFRKAQPAESRMVFSKNAAGGFKNTIRESASCAFQKYHSSFHFQEA
jgi:hypothetical protein